MSLTRLRHTETTQRKTTQSQTHNTGSGRRTFRRLLIKLKALDSITINAATAAAAAVPAAELPSSDTTNSADTETGRKLDLPLLLSVSLQFWWAQFSLSDRQAERQS